MLLFCLMLLALMIAKEVASFDRLGMILLFIAPFLVVVLFNVEWGIYGLLFLGFTVMFMKRMMPGIDANQVGLAMDGLLVLMGLRMAFDWINERKWGLLRSPTLVPILVFILYLVLEVFNPAAPSLAFGLHGSRATLRFLGFFLVLTYFRGKPNIKRFLAVWLSMVFLEGLYGIWQHHHGLLYQEYNWLIESKSAYTHILDGYIRVFGTLGDAATFGFVEVAGALILWALALSTPLRTRILLFLASLPMLYAMVLSYSRGPVVAFAAGLAGLLVASRNWKLCVASLLICTLGIGGLALSGKTQLVDRLATATTPTEDASFQVRMGYLNRFLPEILNRPFGYGLNTTGTSGLVASGGQVVYGTPVGIPTDNQYFKYGLELGWFGLLLFLWLYLSLWGYCYRVYRHQEDPFLKSVALGLFSVMTCFLVGAFSNDIYGQKPLSEFLYLALGLVALLGQHRRCVWEKASPS